MRDKKIAEEFSDRNAMRLYGFVENNRFVADILIKPLSSSKGPSHCINFTCIPPTDILIER